jgi:DNA-directed RNA polymerase I subunit RPA2
LFSNPPKDKSAYPALKAALLPHIESFNALLESDGHKPGLLELGLQEIGTKSVFDGAEGAPTWRGNKLSCKLSS